MCVSFTWHTYIHAPTQNNASKRNPHTHTFIHTYIHSRSKAPANANSEKSPRIHHHPASALTVPQMAQLTAAAAPPQ